MVEQQFLDLLNNSFLVMRDTYRGILEMEPLEAIRGINELGDGYKRIYGNKKKGDTLWIDIYAERRLAGCEEFVGNLDIVERMMPRHSSVWVTEERGIVTQNHDSKIEGGTFLFISDPIDQSRQIPLLVRDHYDCKVLGDVFDAELKKRGQGAIFNAPNTSVTLLRANDIMYSMVLNLLTGEVYLGYDQGVFHGQINSAAGVADISQPVSFKKPSGLETMAMVCYAYGEKYTNNLRGTRLKLFNRDTSVDQPAGPMRFCYLLDDLDTHCQVSFGDLPRDGLIAYNGEKVQELLPGVAMAYFSGGDLGVWKLFCDREYMEQREGKSMTPTLANSLFKGDVWREGINYTHLNQHMTPQNFRDTIVIMPASNEAAITMMDGLVYRENAISVIAPRR